MTRAHRLRCARWITKVNHQFEAYYGKIVARLLETELKLPVDGTDIIDRAENTQSSVN